MSRGAKEIMVEYIETMVRENPHLSEIERGPAEQMVRKHFQLMGEIVGNLELVRRRATQGDIVLGAGKKFPTKKEIAAGRKAKMTAGRNYRKANK